MKGFLTVLAMGASAALGTWVYRDSVQRRVVTAAPPLDQRPAVEVTRLARATIEDSVELVGGLEARADVELRTQISAYVVRLQADAGDFVQQGQVVAELDGSKLEESVSHAQAALQLAQAELEAQQSRAAQAEKSYRRQRELAKTGVITPQQREDAETAMQVAKAQVELEQARVSQADSDLLHAKLALSDARIVAPMSGFVAQRQTEVGDLSQPNVVLMRIVDISKVKTVVHIVERDYPKVVPGQEAHVALDAFPNRDFLGKVVRKAPVLDPLTRTAQVFIEIANPDQVLKPGMHARVRLVFNRHKEARVLPVAALLNEGETRSVFVLTGEPSRAMRRRIRTGYADAEMIEILSGVDPRDRVVVSGAQFLKDGEMVKAIERTGPAVASIGTSVVKPPALKRTN